MSYLEHGKETLRFDLKMIASWIDPGSKVLGLGCGEGDLLAYLKSHKDVNCRGIEQNEARVKKCIEKGLSVIQGDINREIMDYPDQSFDFVILSQTLQQIYNPAPLIRSMLRIGRKVVVSFPNFSHWKIRFQLLIQGKAPISNQLPYEWHDTPNIRVITIKDFRNYARQVNFNILKETAINTHGKDKEGIIVKRLPNWRATYGLFLIGNHQ